MTCNSNTQDKFLLRGSILKSATAFLLLISFEGAAQKQSGTFTALLPADIKQQILVSLEARPAKTTPGINTLEIFSTEWFVHHLPARIWRLEKTNTIHVASEKLPSGDRSLFYTADGSRKFIRFSKK